MRFHFRYLALLAPIAVLALTAAASDAAALRTPPMVIAHRGGAAAFPENTVPAFDNAVRLGVDILEFDMNLTSDDQIVVHHDPVLNAIVCTPDAGAGVQAGPIRQMAVADIQKFDCGSNHRPIYPDQRAVPGARVPTLDSFFGGYRDKDVMFFGEMKMPRKDAPAQVDPEKFAAIVEAAVRKYGLEDRFILQSSDYRTIDSMYAINPRIRTCLLDVDRLKPNYLDGVRAHHASCVVMREAETQAADVQHLREAGVVVFSGVADGAPAWDAYLKLGVDAIFTNDPAGAIEFLKSAGAHD